MSLGVAYCARKAAENEVLAAASTDARMRTQFETLAEFWFGAAYRYQWNEEIAAESRFQSEWADLIHFSNLIRDRNAGVLDA
jgi:hypothetical protein